MPPPLKELISAYDPSLPLAEASTIPASWYTDERIAELEGRRSSPAPGKWWGAWTKSPRPASM